MPGPAVTRAPPTYRQCVQPPEQWPRWRSPPKSLIAARRSCRGTGSRYSVTRTLCPSRTESGSGAARRSAGKSCAARKRSTVASPLAAPSNGPPGTSGPPSRSVGPAQEGDAEIELGGVRDLDPVVGRHMGRGAKSRIRWGNGEPKRIRFPSGSTWEPSRSWYGVSPGGRVVPGMPGRPHSSKRASASST